MREESRLNPEKSKGRRSGPPMSTFAVLPPPTPGAGSGNGSPRGSRPPELPAGKRGGWHHDSVYPSFRLTSFAPRAVNFAQECTKGRTRAKVGCGGAALPQHPPLHFSVDA